MRRKKTPTSLKIILPVIFFFIIAHCTVSAGETGVGVINVPPEYSYIEIKQESGLVIATLIISDYNSWSDIYSIHLSIEYNLSTSDDNLVHIPDYSYRERLVSKRIPFCSYGLLLHIQQSVPLTFHLSKMKGVHDQQ